MDSELEKLHHGSTSSESQVNSPLISTPVLFQTIHVDIHENERWFPIIGWGTSRLPNDLPNFTPVMFTHILDSPTAPEQETGKQSFAESNPSHHHSILAPSVAAFHRAFQESLMQNAMLNTDNINYSNAGSSRNTLNQVNRQMRASMSIRPLHIILPSGYAWNGFWEVAKSHDKGTDGAGWRYASDFVASPSEKALQSSLQQQQEQQEEQLSNIHSGGDHHDSNQHSDDTQKNNQGKATSETVSRARFKKTQTPICVVRYRTWRRQVRVVIAPHKQKDNSNTNKEVDSKENMNKPVEDIRNREDAKLDAESHAEHQAMPSSSATTTTQSQQSQLLPTLSNMTLDEYELTEEDEANELYLQQKEAEMELAESLKQRRLHILSNGEEWTREMDLAAEEELRNFIRENRAKAQHESASSHRRSANRSFANPFFHESTADNSETSANAHLQDISAHDANHGNVNSNATNSTNKNNNHINNIIGDNMNIHFGSQSGDVKELDMLHTYSTCPEFGPNAQRDITREASHAEWVMEKQLKDSFTRSAEEQEPFTHNQHHDNSPYLHPTFSPIDNNNMTNNDNINNNNNKKNSSNNDGNEHVLEFRSQSVLPDRVDGEDTQVIVSKFVAASPHEYDNTSNDSYNNGDNESDASRSGNAFAGNDDHSSNSVLVDGGNDFDAIFQKFVSNPETRHV